MYIVSKERGYNQSVVVENTDTHSTTMLGRPTIAIINIITKDKGMSTTIMTVDPWLFNISDETAKELIALAMPIHPPKRKKKAEQVVTNNNISTNTQEKPKKQPVDIFNLIFGTE